MPTKTLVPFSGGIDSTYILWKLLTETDDEVTAMYLNEEHYYGNIFGDKSSIQYQRSLNLVDELRKIRDFRYIKHNVRQNDITDEIQNKMLIIIQCAAPFINDGSYDRIASGSSYEDKRQKVVEHLEYTPMYYAEHRLFERLCNRGEYWQPLVHGEWHIKYNRSHAMVNLPSHILSMTTGCNKPIIENETDEFIECEKCYKCNMKRKYNELLSQGMTCDEITDWKFKKCYEYGGGKLMVSASKWIFLETGIGGPKDLTKEKVIEEYKITGHFNTIGLSPKGLWKGLLEPD
jgi:7-cyano-7-deazaguanine synthase in queuosine biosynthesis